MHGHCRRIGKVDNTPLDERAAIVDSYYDAVAVFEVVYSYPGAERQRAVSGGHGMHIKDFPACRGSAVEGAAVPRSNPFLTLDNWGRRLLGL